MGPEAVRLVKLLVRNIDIKGCRLMLTALVFFC
jgi:hypothetical protein